MRRICHDCVWLFYSTQLALHPIHYLLLQTIVDLKELIAKRTALVDDHLAASFLGQLTKIGHCISDGTEATTANKQHRKIDASYFLALLSAGNVSRQHHQRPNSGITQSCAHGEFCPDIRSQNGHP